MNEFHLLAGIVLVFCLVTAAMSYLAYRGGVTIGKKKFNDEFESRRHELWEAEVDVHNRLEDVKKKQLQVVKMLNDILLTKNIKSVLFTPEKLEEVRRVYSEYAKYLNEEAPRVWDSTEVSEAILFRKKEELAQSIREYEALLTLDLINPEKVVSN